MEQQSTEVDAKDKARQFYEKALTLQSGNTDAMFNLGLVTVDEG